MGHGSWREGAAKDGHPDEVGAPLLECSGLAVSFGGVQALADVSFSVGADELVAVIGPNGAGKTSLLNVISGFYKASRGKVLFNGARVDGRPAHRVAGMGIARTFQGTHLFGGMSVVENLLVGRHLHTNVGLVQAFLQYPWAWREEVDEREEVEEIVEFLEIESIRHQPIASLSYGLRKRVDLGRALAMAPRLLLLDEPMAGMNGEEKEDMARFILDIRESRGIPVVMVEHDMSVVMDMANRVVVLDFGRKIADDVPSAVRSDPTVIKAYLGAPS